MGAFMPWHLLVTILAIIVIALVGALITRLSLPAARSRFAARARNKN